MYSLLWFYLKKKTSQNKNPAEGTVVFCHSVHTPSLCEEPRVYFLFIPTSCSPNNSDGCFLPSAFTNKTESLSD